MTSTDGPRMPFFPKADAVVLSAKQGFVPPRPSTVWPIFDLKNVDRKVEAWPSDAEKNLYPPPEQAFATAPIPGETPETSTCLTDGYLRPFLAANERLRSCMLWYYTRDLLHGAEFLHGLQEKAHLAQESTGWEFVVIGVLDVNFYIRLASIGLPLAILPRGETICAHTVTQPPGSIFLLPNMMEDWRFKQSPYVESGGLRAYAGAPLRLQNDTGDCVALGSLCVASSSSQEPLTKSQQQTLVRLADWVVSDIIQYARARRQRERRQMSELISVAQAEADGAVSEEPVLRILRTAYPEAEICLQSSKADHIEIQGRGPIPIDELEGGLWEDTDYLDDFIANWNHQEFPSTRVVRVLAAPCEIISGPSLLLVVSKDFRLVFDDVDLWFIQTCASMLTQIWQKRLLTEVMRAKEKFLRGFSHQLRTPIHGILGSVELLAEELMARSQNLPLHHHQQQSNEVSMAEVSTAVKNIESSVYLETIKTAGRDLISIVNSMITLNRWADIAMTDRHYALHTLTEFEAELSSEMCKATTGDSGHRAAVLFSHDVPPDCDRFRTDLNLLRDSVLPVILNAIKNTPAAGVVTVTATLRPDERQLIVDVEDSGCGIQPHDQQRIFDPYEKVDMQSSGAGLGLTLASKFATLLHGSVVLVSSEVGRGSHFRASFHEVDCPRLPQPVQILSRRLENLPSKFYKETLDCGESVTLSTAFGRFLVAQGFETSDTVDDSFVVLDFSADAETRRSALSRIPSGRVAICLIPGSIEDATVEDLPRNVICIREPFLTSTMVSALTEADNRSLGLKGSNIQQSHDDKLSLAGLKIHEVAEHDEPPESTDIVSELKSPPILEDADPSTTVSIVPPAEPLITTQPPAIITIPSNPAIARPTALLVDDNNVNLRILKMYCTKRRLPFHCAVDGKEAVEIFTQQQTLARNGQGEGIHLIIMDLQMPVCDGIEATRQIRQLERENEWGTSALFIVTGQDSPSDRTAAEEVGADEYYVKPVGIKVLDRGVLQYFPSFEGS